MWLEPTAAHCSTTDRKRSNAPSIRPAANSTASSINPSAKPQITHKSLGRGITEPESLVITPKPLKQAYDEDSIDLRLGTYFLMPQIPPQPYIDPGGAE